MYKGQKFTAIIPARAGSKGIINKNIISVANHPLISYSIEAAKKSEFIDEVFVSTDGKEISDISKEYGSEVILRPKKISDNITMPDDAVTHSVNYLNKPGKKTLENIVFMQPTSPLRCDGDLDKAIIKFTELRCDSLFSAVNLHPCLWSSSKNDNIKPVNYNPFKRIRRQIDDNNVVENGSFYISKQETYLKYNNRFGKNISYSIMNYICLTQVDDINELKIIDAILESKQFDYLKLIKPVKNK